MSNGYSYKGAVSPVNTGGYGGHYGYGGYSHQPTAAFPTSVGPNMPMTLPANVGPNMPMTLPANVGPNMPMTMPASMGPNVSANMGATMMPNANMMPTSMGPNAPMMAQQAFPPSVPSGSFVNPMGGNIVAVPVAEESYVENILRLNRGKMASFYMTYENNREWNAKVFRGIIEAAGRDHIIISDPSTNMRYLLLTLNLNYVTFDGPIAYEYPFDGEIISNVTPLAPREEN